MKIKKLVNTLTTPLEIEVISIALELELFELLQTPLCLKEIANSLKFDKGNLKVFLDALLVLKLLKLKNDKYKNSSFSSKYFTRSSEYCIKDLYLYRKRFFEERKKDIFLFLKNKNQDFNINQKEWQKASKKYFFQEQKILLAKYISKLIAQINEDKKIKKMLDLGCSSGILSLETLKENPNINAVLFDFEEVITQAQINIKKYKLNSRVKTIYGNIVEDSIGRKYDLILCSNILHLLPKKQMILQKIYKALNKNGTLLVIHKNFLDKNSTNKDLYFYNILSLLYKEKKIDDMLFSNMILESGFKSVKSFLSEESLHINTKIFIAKK